jgi:hypothetical protein
MNWIHIVEAAVVASVLASFTDWYFFGVLFHDRYHTIPGVWKKYEDKKDEIRTISITTLYYSFSSFVFVFLCDYFHFTNLTASIFLAIALWFMLPLPILLSYGMYIRMDRAIVLSHSLGWLARLLVTALCAGLFLTNS